MSAWKGDHLTLIVSLVAAQGVAVLLYRGYCEWSQHRKESSELEVSVALGRCPR